MAKKFCAICKVNHSQTKNFTGFVKYRFNDIDKFILFIQKKYDPVYFVNIFVNDPKYPTYQKLFATWGRKKGLEPAR